MEKLPKQYKKLVQEVSFIFTRYSYYTANLLNYDVSKYGYSTISLTVKKNDKCLLPIKFYADEHLKRLMKFEEFITIQIIDYDEFVIALKVDTV